MADGNRRPIFVVGCARSGTTMLQLMLHAHPRIAVPPETRFVVPLYDRRERFGDLTDRRNRRRLARFIVGRRRSKFHDLGLDAELVRRRIIRGEPTIGAAIAIVFEAYAERFGKSRWGDKRPAYIQRLDVILRLFPDAQIVHIIRDGRDCVASLKSMPWWRGGVIHAVAYWKDAMRAGTRAQRALPSDQYIAVRYEDLVADPRTHCRRLCEFFGEPFDAAMLAPHEVSDVGVPERKTWHANTRREINAGAVSRFERDLERHELALMELVCRRQLRQHGYERSSPGMPRPLDVARYARCQLRRRLGKLRLRHTDRQIRARYRQPVAAGASQVSRTNSSASV